MKFKKGVLIRTGSGALCLITKVLGKAVWYDALSVQRWDKKDFWEKKEYYEKEMKPSKLKTHTAIKKIFIYDII